MPKAHKGAWLGRPFAALTVVLGALLAQTSGILDPLDRWSADLRFRGGERPATGDIIVADIDARSLQEIGTWPWPRSIHAKLIDRLVSLGATEIAFDIDFSTRSNPIDDAALAAALERAGGRVILATFAQAASGRLGETGLSYNVPIEPFAANAWTATVNVRPHRDGKIRSLRFGEVIAGVPTQSLSAALAEHPAPPRGEFPIDFTIKAGSIDQIPLIDIVRGHVHRSRIAGKKVIVGASAIELRDLFHVPVYGVIPGSVLLAVGAETLMQDRILESTPLPLRIGGLILIAAVAACAFRRLRWGIFLGCLMLASAAIEIGALLLQVAGSWILHTGLWQAGLIGLAGFAIGSEIDLRRILLLISRTETRNVRTILDQVIADNFAGVLVVEEDGTIRRASRSALRLLGMDPTMDLQGRRIEEVVSAPLAEVARSPLEATSGEADQQPQELLYTLPDGREERLFEYVVTPSRLSGGVTTQGRALPDQVVTTLTFVDVTERRHAEDRIAYLARFDTLTSLPNRNQFEERLQEALDLHRMNDTGCAVLFIDLDRFKGVNDTLGHDYGDRLLAAVAARLEESVRSQRSGDLVARFGGDEYAVLMSGSVAARDAETLAGTLIERVGEPYELDGHRLIVGLSVGIALPQGDHTSAGSLMKDADAALYRAKSGGGGTYRVFEEQIGAAIRARSELEVELWDAFDGDEFEVFYQPQIDLADRTVVGVEALLRWRHPTRGYVSPALFVPVAEAVGLIEPLGRWILQKACAEVARWQVPLKLAVNISPVQFVRGDLLATVGEALAQSRLPAERLNLEITESLFLHENKLIAETIDQLRALGVTFAIDDFGTGYSSLSYIRKFPIQKVKIDQSFVSELPHDVESAAIVRAVCALAQGLNIRVNAEGIETEEQLAALRLSGCAEGQGYLFARPQPAASMLRLLDGQASIACVRSA
jgi:diguanylate cyclase (GGDEF)-like protein